MPVHELATMTWEEVRDLDRSRAVAVLPVGAIEAHGPHLPLATDVMIAEAMARAGSARLAGDGWLPVLLPSLAYTPAGFARDFPGTIAMEPGTVTAMLLEVAANVARDGFAALAVANAHLDPGHLGAIRAAADRAGALLPFVFPDVTRRPWAPRLTEEFRSGACHAGRYETSVVLAVDPASVREGRREHLAPNPASLSDAIRDGKRTFREAGGPDAYFGFPADATAAEGRETIAVLGAILAEAVAEALGEPGGRSGAERRGDAGSGTTGTEVRP